MNTERFNAVVDDVLSKTNPTERRAMLTRSVLTSKQKEYSSDVDRLHNFKRAAELYGGTMEQCLAGFLLKHVISIIDILDGLELSSVAFKLNFERLFYYITNNQIPAEEIYIDLVLYVNCVEQIVLNTNEDKRKYETAMIEEKFGDTENYLVLLIAMTYERKDNG